MRQWRLAAVVLLSGMAVRASAETAVSLTVSGNQALGTIALAGGISAELTIGFENVVGLTPAALDVSVSLVNPLDPGLLSRLPPLNLLQQVTAPAAFPVLLRIEPAAGSSLSFSGVARVDLHTPNLQLNSLVPLALFRSSDGGPFQDITVSEGAGSYRVCGSEGGFSEFLIVLDLRAIDTIISAKFDDLQGLLGVHSAALPSSLASALQEQLAQARTDYQAGATLQAITDVSAFLSTVRAHSGSDIPDVWRAHDTSVVNVAGLLRAAGETLRFSLNRKANQ